MRLIILAVFLLSSSFLTVKSEIIVFKSIDNKKFILNEESSTFEETLIKDVLFTNLNNDRFSYNEKNNNWDKISNMTSINYFCDDINALKKLKENLNLNIMEFDACNDYFRMNSILFRYNSDSQSGLIILKK